MKRRSIAIFLCITLCVIGLYFGVTALGRYAAQKAPAKGPSYLVDFDKIDCELRINGQKRAELLAEVMYLGNFKRFIDVRNPSLPQFLGEAFRRHRDVEYVGIIVIDWDGKEDGKQATIRAPVFLKKQPEQAK